MFDAAEVIDLYDALFKRKSVRKFENKSIREMELEVMVEKAKGFFRPSPDASIDFRILRRGQIKNASLKAPYYAAVYAKEKAGATINAAFMLAQMDLWLSKNGFGTCWIGMSKPAQSFAKSDSGLPLIIMLAFGHPAELPYRESVSEFKRKPMPEITSIQGMDEILEAVRLAPSAVNRQPWFLTGTDERIDLFMKKQNFLTRRIFGKLSYVDMGIALCYLWLSAAIHDRFQGFSRDHSEVALEDYDYVWSVALR